MYTQSIGVLNNYSIGIYNRTYVYMHTYVQLKCWTFEWIFHVSPENANIWVLKMLVHTTYRKKHFAYNFILYELLLIIIRLFLHLL